VNPPEMWIRCEGAFPSIIAPATFAAAQEIIAERRQRWSEQKLQRRRNALKREKEQLARALDDSVKASPRAQPFPTLDRAYRLAAHQPNVTAWIRKPLESDAILRATVMAITTNVEQSGGRAVFNRKTGFLIINDDLVVALGVACPASDEAGCQPRHRPPGALIATWKYGTMFCRTFVPHFHVVFSLPAQIARSVTRSQPNSRPCRVAKLRTLPPRSATSTPAPAAKSP
jgi:hypothetical protein